ncbi:hypothetical protein CPC16_000525 [Podila verticillata]|nr:hypothetical protein CPC16_000525 [Podila verticillata]
MELIPMGTLNKESLGFDGKPANQRQNDLVMSLNLLQQANLIQYQDTSNKVAVFGIDRSHHAKENGRPEITSALSTVLSHLITSHTSFEQDLKKRLIDIYTEMPSPLPTAIDPLSNKSDKATQRLLDSIIDLDAPDGMRTKLYEYQKRSIWKMLKRELCPGYILDPSLIPMKDENNSDYYIDYSTGLGVCRTPTRKWDDVRGGLLCEDMHTRDFALKLLVLTSNDKVIPEIRWKRVIVDEGHTMSADLSNHALLASKLHADRRWICTGTPTSNLANLVPSATSTWSDQSDLTRLSSLIFSFFQIHPYVDNKNLFLKEIRKPFIDHSTVSLPCISLTTLSSVKRLRHLLERLMTRNRPEDINQSVTLPPLFEKVVRLDLEYFQILSLNSQIALIQANAILTEREDQDYFFHPSNQKHLRQVIDNLNNGCFWYSGGGGSYATLIKGTLQQAKNGLEAHYSTDGGKYPPTDIALLKEVIHNLQLALSDPSWNTLIAAQDVGKLNYIVCQILYHHPNEKCIVFCQSPNAIYYIHEFLTLAKIRCLTYRSGMTQSERSSNIMTFNTSENVAAIIMDTKHAAFGIDLSSASRVYFVSPVWQTATMRQAVKRAHRIGQTRPVYIETLVIRDSFEEAILNRRSELDKEEPSMGHSKESGQGSNGRPHIKSNLSRKGTSMADDGKFRELIRHIDFMPVSYRRQDRPYPLLSDYVLDECEVMKDFKVPLSRNYFCEIQRYSMETEHYSDSNVQLSPIKFEDDSRCAQDEMAYEGDIDLDSTMKESTMIVHERFEIIDEEVVCKEDEKKELGLKKEQELEPTTRNTESRLSRFPPELVKRETSYEKEISNSKRVRFD